MDSSPNQVTASGTVRPAIRCEYPEDAGPVRKLLQVSFGTSTEADVVDTLRDRHAIIGSWTMELDGQLVGYIVFSPVRLEPALPDTPVVGLGPIAIHPHWQRQGHGSRLIAYSLRQLRGLGIAAVVVVGDPNYYPRFGFQAASSLGLKCPFAVSSDSFLTIELAPGSLTGYHGAAHYHRAFDVFE